MTGKKLYDFNSHSLFELMIKTTISRVMNIGPVQRQSAISLFWQLAITAVGFASTMYFAHAVGANVMGTYFLLIAYYSVLNMISDGGFGGACPKAHQ